MANDARASNVLVPQQRWNNGMASNLINIIRNRERGIGRSAFAPTALESFVISFYFILLSAFLSIRSLPLSPVSADIHFSHSSSPHSCKLADDVHVQGTSASKKRFNSQSNIVCSRPSLAEFVYWSFALCFAATCIIICSSGAPMLSSVFTASTTSNCLLLGKPIAFAKHICFMFQVRTS